MVFLFLSVLLTNRIALQIHCEYTPYFSTFKPLHRQIISPQHFCISILLDTLSRFSPPYYLTDCWSTTHSESYLCAVLKLLKNWLILLATVTYTAHDAVEFGQTDQSQSLKSHLPAQCCYLVNSGSSGAPHEHSLNDGHGGHLQDVPVVDLRPARTPREETTVSNKKRYTNAE